MAAILFPRNSMTKYQKILSVIFIAAVIWSAIKPLSGVDWLLEISPVLVAIPLLIILGRIFRISNFSYTLILIYMLMPIVQAHYGVAHVPWGFGLGQWLNSPERNMFDRVTHFSFGLLWFYPLYEIIRQSIPDKVPSSKVGIVRKKSMVPNGTRFLNFFIPFSVLMAFASLYEIIEWAVAIFSGPNLAFLFIGAQQDAFDSQKDMACTLAGALVTIIATYWILHMRRSRPEKPLIQKL